MDKYNYQNIILICCALVTAVGGFGTVFASGPIGNHILKSPSGMSVPDAYYGRWLFFRAILSQMTSSTAQFPRRQQWEIMT